MSRVRSTVAATAALALAGGLGLAVGGSPASLADDSTRIQVQSATPPTTTYAVVKTITVGPSPEGIAVNDVDDTVYVANNNSVSVIAGLTGMVTDTVSFGPSYAPLGVAVHQIDDSVFVTMRTPNTLVTLNGRNLDDTFAVALPGSAWGVAVLESDDSVYAANGSNPGRLSMVQGSTVAQTVAIGSDQAAGVAINQADDSVYVANQAGLFGTVSVMTVRDLDDSIILGGFGSPWGVAVNQNDDTVYVTNIINFGPLKNTLAVINGRNTDDSVTIPVGDAPAGVAVDQRDDTVYVANLAADTVSVINGRVLDDSVAVDVGDSPVGVAVDGAGANQGLTYVTNRNDGTVSVIARVSPSVSSPSGSVGSAVTISVSAPQVAYDLDDSTVDSISIGGVTATGLTAGAGDTWTVTAPAGSGTVPVEVTFAGGLTASAGTFTYASDPPAPVVPPSAPRDVVGTPGDGQARISWTAPASAGSFPITDYEAVVSPGGQSCLVKAPTLSCTITGLTNGTAYTATVRALNGAGWGSYSDASLPFTPVAPVVQTISISGSRGEVRGKPGIRVTGRSSGFDGGSTLRPWHRFPGQTGFTEGVATIRVQEQGDFTWQRRTGKTITVVVRSVDGLVESNRLILRVR